MSLPLPLPHPPHSITYTILDPQRLYELPEPLLGFDNAEAALACDALISMGSSSSSGDGGGGYDGGGDGGDGDGNTVEDLQRAGQRNLRLLCLQAPW